jgi:hypothetical protein
MLGRHHHFLVALSAELLQKSELDGAAIQTIAAQHKLPCTIHPEGFQIIPDYAEYLNKERAPN